MLKVALCGSVVLTIGLAACATPPRPGPPVWSANYAVPFDTMVNCLVSSPTSGMTVSQPVTGLGGIVTLSFIPNNVPQAQSYYAIYHLPNDGTQVNWHRAGDVGGLDWIDTEARTRANRCGGVPYQAALGTAGR
jgi:hypothetical protein